MVNVNDEIYNLLFFTLSKNQQILEITMYVFKKHSFENDFAMQNKQKKEHPYGQKFQS